MLKRSEAKEKVEEYKRLFEPIIGKQIEITIDQHKAVSTLVSIEHVKATGHKLLDKRDKGDGGFYNPQIMTLFFEDCKLTFVIEDIIDVFACLGGFDVIFEKTTVQLRIHNG
jgi:hypothetical protein